MSALERKAGQRLRDPPFLRCNQYGTTEKLAARAALYREFLSAPEPWQDWLFSRLSLRPGDCVADLGCGSGLLWQVDRGDNAVALKRVVFVDFSFALLMSCRRSVEEKVSGHWICADVDRSIPVRSPFDRVVASHLLYHLPKPARFLKEVHGLLETEGFVAITAPGSRHLAAVHELLERGGVGSCLPRASVAAPLVDLIAQIYPRIEREDYVAELRITRKEPLVDYILTFADLIGSPAPEKEKIEELVDERLMADSPFCVEVHNWLIRAWATG